MGIDEIVQRLLRVGRNLRHVLVAVSLAGHAESSKYEATMISRDRPAAFADERRMWDRRFFANGLHMVYDVCRVLIERIVNARFEVRLRSVVINTESATDIQEF